MQGLTGEAGFQLFLSEGGKFLFAQLRLEIHSHVHADNRLLNEHVHVTLVVHEHIASCVREMLIFEKRAQQMLQTDAGYERQHSHAP